MKCLRCGPLIKAIDAYLAKTENDLYEQLTMEGYLKAKESLNTVDEIEEVVTKLLEDNADDLLKELADAIDLETFFKDNWPKFKNKSKLSRDLFDVFHTQFSTIMPTYVEAYVQKTDAELTVTKAVILPPGGMRRCRCVSICWAIWIARVMALPGWKRRWTPCFPAQGRTAALSAP